MRLPSIEKLARGARDSALRFPMVLVCAVVSAIAVSILADGSADQKLFGGVLYVASLGIPLFLAVSLVAERRGASRSVLWVSRLALAGALVALFVVRTGWSDPVRGLRYAQLSLAAHLLVAAGPYLGFRERNGFWQFNRTLLLRFLLAAVFSLVLYAGLSVALLAVDNLLGMDVEEETYLRLWGWIAFLFNTWFFLAGVPDDLEALDGTDDYPAVLKVFSQYILSPLVSVYMAILFLYLGRILVTRVWPSGWIGYLVSSVAAAGILSLLLLHPIEERTENRWVSRYASGFWIGLIPANVMLLLAAWKRIQQYAVTEPRYFLVILSLWLAGMSLYFSLTRSRRIKVIPVTLAALAIVTFAGPWSAYSVSRASQTARMRDLLVRNDMLIDGRAVPPSGSVPVEDRREIGAVIRYLARYHGTGSIEGWFAPGRLAEIDTVAAGTGPTERWKADERAALITRELGIEYVGSWTPGEGEGFNFFADPAGPPVPIAGYEHLLRSRGLTTDTLRAPQAGLAFAWDEARLGVVVLRDGSEALVLPVGPLVDRAREHARTRPPGRHLPAELLRLEGEAEGVRVGLLVTSIGGFVEPDADEGRPAGETTGRGYRITVLSADVLYRVDPGEASP